MLLMLKYPKKILGPRHRLTGHRGCRWTGALTQRSTTVSEQTDEGLFRHRLASCGSPHSKQRGADLLGESDHRFRGPTRRACFQASRVPPGPGGHVTADVVGCPAGV